MSIVPSFHDCLKHYELRSVNQLFKCQGCKMDGFGQGFQCKLCNDTLHKECRYPKATATHELFGGSTLKFRDKPVSYKNVRTYCDACGKDISGFNYHCAENTLDVHPCCLNLPTGHAISRDKVLHLKAKVVSKCMWCKKNNNISDNENVLGWSYSSSCNKYHIHVYCMMDRIREACIINGNRGLAKVVDVQTLAKRGRKWYTPISKTFKNIISIIKILCSALLGDPMSMFFTVHEEFFSRGFQW